MSRTPAKGNIFSTPEPWNLVAPGYARTIMRVLAQYSKEAIALTGVSRGEAVLDVACGPGTLSLLAAGKGARVTALDFSKPMVALLRRRLHEKSIRNMKVLLGDGQALPFADHSFDAAFSMFGLMFFPNRPKGFAELYRILKPGGRAAVSSWAPISRSPSMKVMFGALRAMNPDLPEPRKAIKSLEDPRIFKAEMSAAGFRNVRIRRVTKPFLARTPKAYWSMMVEGSAPIVLLRKELGAKEWKKRELHGLAHLHRHWPSIAGRLTSDAWIGTGTKH